MIISQRKKIFLVCLQYKFAIKKAHQKSFLKDKIKILPNECHRNISKSIKRFLKAYSANIG